MKEGWTYKKLGEICDFQGGSQPPKEEWIDEYKEGYIRMLQIRDFTQSRAFTKEYIKITNRIKTCKKDDILIGRYGASVGKILTGEEGAYNVAIMKTIPDESVISKDFAKLFFLSPSFQHYLQTVCNSRAAQAGFSKSDISDYLIPIPPIAEQERIVAELDLLSGIIEKKKEQLKAYDQLAQSIFYTMFGDPIDNPKGWEVKKLEALCDRIVDCPHSTPKKVDYVTQYPCIRTSELKGGTVQWETMQYLDECEYNKRITRLKPIAGDIVFGREGSIGDAVILPKGYHFSLGQRTMLLRANGRLISNVFLHRTILSEWVKRQIDAVNVSSTVAHVNIKDFKLFDIPVPPLSLQQEFAEKVEAIERQKALVQQSIEETQTMFDYTMDKYFG